MSRKTEKLTVKKAIKLAREGQLGGLLLIDNKIVSQNVVASNPFNSRFLNFVIDSKFDKFCAKLSAVLPKIKAVSIRLISNDLDVEYFGFPSCVLGRPARAESFVCDWYFNKYDYANPPKGDCVEFTYSL